MTTKNERTTRYPRAEAVAEFLCAVIDLTTEGRREGYAASKACNKEEFLEALYAGEPEFISAYHAIHKSLTPQTLVPDYLQAQNNSTH